jgi:hypothetical protein
MRQLVSEAQLDRQHKQTPAGYEAAVDETDQSQILALKDVAAHLRSVG